MTQAGQAAKHSFPICTLWSEPLPHLLCETLVVRVTSDPWYEGTFWTWWGDAHTVMMEAVVTMP